MKKLLLILVFFSFTNLISQSGIAIDNDGNEFNWTTYGGQDWAVENASATTFRDGTLIPEITDLSEWANASNDEFWCYFNNDSTKSKLYNWWVVEGGQGEFAPEGWRIPSKDDWDILVQYLIDNGFTYDNTPTSDIDLANHLGKAIASESGWSLEQWQTPHTYGPANNQTENNSTGFNGYPAGERGVDGNFRYEGQSVIYWSSTWHQSGQIWTRRLGFNSPNLELENFYETMGNPVRYVRDSQTANINQNYSFNFNITPNPTVDFLNISCLNLNTAIIYNILGKEVIKVSNQNRIDVSFLSKGVYFIKVSDGINTSTKKFIKE